MKITDEMLYAAAPEAAERYLNTLPKQEDCVHGFSRDFEERMRFLPPRRKKRLWKRIVLQAAVIALPAPKEWTTPRGLEVFGPRSFGHDVDYRPYC